MSAPSIPAILAGIEARLETIAGLMTVSDVRPGQVNPPAAVVGVPPIPDYWGAMKRGVFELEPTIMVLTSTAVDRPGQLSLAEYANPTGSSSVVAAIYASRTLGGVVDDCYVREFRPLGIDEVGVIGYYGGIFTLYVVAQGGS